ncbi:MAG: hypothetical protein NVS9B15_20670 [Acidobacteriaceae bacterium]
MGITGSQGFGSGTLLALTALDEKEDRERREERERGQHHGPMMACAIKVPLGNGYCAYGRYEGNACYYDGIGRC